MLDFEFPRSLAIRFPILNTTRKGRLSKSSGQITYDDDIGIRIETVLDSRNVSSCL